MSDVELEVTALAAGGDGVARDAGGRVTFVPRTAVGDRAVVKLVEEKKRFARGELVRLVVAAPERVEPPCPHFVAGCGGCQWQHIARPAQLAAKQAIVEGALRKLTGLALERIADPAPAYGWRRRARFHVVGGEVGLFAYATNRLIKIDRCPQLEPALDEGLRAAIAAKPIDGELHLLLGHDGKVASSVEPGRDERRETTTDAGNETAEVIEIEPGLYGRASDFAQASRAGNAALIAITRAALGKGPGSLLELYAGAGNFTRAFLEDGWKVVASDAVAPAKPLDNVRFELGNTRDVAKRLAKRAAKTASRANEQRADGAQSRGSLAEPPVFDAIVLDPPRTGAADALDAIVQLRARTIVYVSCEPATLARDAEVLVAAGYRAERAWPLDMMPQTSHVEVVMKLVRA
jgi:23S rRNA (uracil1939-C5)-methyltransferase